jgi:hypothetical protein
MKPSKETTKADRKAAHRVKMMSKFFRKYEDGRTGFIPVDKKDKPDGS